jgi:succinate dehydrogenase / fumarate reductase, membrane anchor subunit
MSSIKKANDINAKLNGGIGSKRTVTGAGYGFKDWLAQRVTAVIMVVFTLVLLCSFLFSGIESLSYDKWASFFSNPILKTLTFLTFTSLCYHAWIGIRDIWMDYVKPVSIRLTLHVLTILWLLGCVAYCAQILWRLA